MTQEYKFGDHVVRFDHERIYVNSHRYDSSEVQIVSMGGPVSGDVRDPLVSPSHLQLIGPTGRLFMFENNMYGQQFVKDFFSWSEK